MGTFSGHVKHYPRSEERSAFLIKTVRHLRHFIFTKTLTPSLPHSLDAASLCRIFETTPYHSHSIILKMTWCFLLVVFQKTWCFSKNVMRNFSTFNHSSQRFVIRLSQRFNQEVVTGKNFLQGGTILIWFLSCRKQHTKISWCFN